MSREKEAWGAIKAILGGSPELSYIKSIYEGFREDVPDTMLPCIYMEPDTTPEELYALPNRYKVTMTIHLIAEILCSDMDKQIFGDDDNKGIIDVANDIKSVLAKTPNLNGKCQKFSFPGTKYNNQMFPYRQVDITMSIELITVGTQR